MRIVLVYRDTTSLEQAAPIAACSAHSTTLLIVASLINRLTYAG